MMTSEIWINQVITYKNKLKTTMNIVISRESDHISKI